MLFLPDFSTVIWGADRLVASAPRLVIGAPRPVAGAVRCSQVHRKANGSLQSTLQFDHPGILVRQLSDTPRGSQWHNHILQMWHWHGFNLLPMDVRFPHALNPPKGHHWVSPIGCRTYGFVHLRTVDDCFIPCFPLLLSYTGFGSAGGWGLKWWIKSRRHVCWGQVSAGVYRSLLWHVDQYPISSHYALHMYSLALVCSHICISFICGQS